LQWNNWSGRLSGSPERIESPRDEADVVQVIRHASSDRSRIRCVGAGHSHSPLVVSNETLLDLSALSGIVDASFTRKEATLRAGTRISALGVPLRQHGLALHNQGDIDRQAIAGAIATGTHGTGRTLQNLSASIVGARLVLADGRVVDCDAENKSELFEVCRLSLGAVGVLTELRLSVREAYRLEERMWLEDLDSILENIEGLTSATRHFEFFWQPGKKAAACKALTETLEAPRYPLAAEGARLAWSDEVLANDRADKHTEMEYSVPTESGPDCFRALREMIARDFPDLAWPVEYRTLAADDVWLSTANGRETVTISVHQGVDLEDRPLFRAAEEIFLSYEGRPHWGKVHYLGADQLAKAHPRWNDWWRVRNEYDPGGLFMNPYLERLGS